MSEAKRVPRGGKAKGREARGLDLGPRTRRGVKLVALRPQFRHSTRKDAICCNHWARVNEDPSRLFVPRDARDEVKGGRVVM